VATKRELEQLLKDALARGDRLEKANERLEKKLDEMLERQDEMQKQIKDLLRELAEAKRAAKRQAAPFARRKRVAQRRKPGRKLGHEGASQAVPDHVDEEFFEPLDACPCWPAP